MRLGRSGQRPSLIAVADGAGSASHAREGSRLAARAVRGAARRWLRSNPLSALEQHHLADWFESARAALLRRARRLDVDPGECSTTLLFALLSDEVSAFGQIGDGAIVLSTKSGGWSCFAWPQHGEYANSTKFVNDADVRSEGTFGVYRGRLERVALFTDGIESLVLNHATRSPYGPFFDSIFTLFERRGVTSIPLARWINSSELDDQTDDDRTLVLCARSDRPPL